MAVEICERIGSCNVDRNGSITELQREFLVRDGCEGLEIPSRNFSGSRRRKVLEWKRNADGVW